MIHRLEQALQDAFLAVGDASPASVGATNEAMWHLLQSGVFKGAYAGHELLRDNQGHARLVYSRRGVPTPANPLEQITDENGDIVPSASCSGTAAATVDTILACAADKDDMVGRILHADPTIRTAPIIEMFDNDALRAFTAALMGPWGDFSLSRCGIKYHHPNHARNDMRYLVAHTGLEVAGVLGIARGAYTPHGLCVPYVSVNPGFRRQGISTRLYGHFIDLALKEGKYIVRSNACQDTPSATTSRFDAMLSQAGCIHVISGTYMEAAISDVFKPGLDESVLGQMAGSCAIVARARQEMGRSGEQFALVDHGQAMLVRSLVSGPKPGMAC